MLVVKERTSPCTYTNITSSRGHVIYHRDNKKRRPPVAIPLYCTMYCIYILVELPHSHPRACKPGQLTWLNGCLARFPIGNSTSVKAPNFLTLLLFLHTKGRVSTRCPEPWRVKTRLKKELHSWRRICGMADALHQNMARYIQSPSMALFDAALKVKT